MVRNHWSSLFFPRGPFCSTATAILAVVLGTATALAQTGVQPASTSGVNAEPLSGGPTMGQTGSTGAAAAASTLDLQNNPYFGGVVSGPAIPGVIQLTIPDAIDRGLKYNLGLYLSDQATLQARGARLRALSGLLPNLSAHVAESEQQINLAAYGFPPTPGVTPIRGPFSVFDARAAVSQSLSLSAWNNYKAAVENIAASQLTYRNARDLVVLITGGLYMQALAAEARIQAVQVQLETAQSLYNQAVDLKKAGITPGIDVLRAQVELQAQQQRLVAAKNEFEKNKLQLARAIGLPVGQQYELAERKMPYAPVPPITFEQALAQAYQHRSDYHAAQRAVRAAELTRKAAGDERLPSLQFNADYGTIGPTPGNSHGTFSAAGALVIPIFQGGRIKGAIQQADSALSQRKAVLDDLRNRIDYDVRTSFLDLNSAAQQVDVAKSSVGLAQEQVNQARDRFKAGVTNNIEVIQAQEALATSQDNYINALLAHNLAKLSLARSIGLAEEATKEFLGGHK